VRERQRRSVADPTVLRPIMASASLFGFHPHVAAEKLGLPSRSLVTESLETMTVQNLSAQPPFITKDGSTIRSILDRTNAPVQNQSIAEARVPAGARTERHYHKNAE